MSFVYKNNAISRLKFDAAAADLTLALLDGEGEKFPALAPGDYFIVTIDDRRTGQVEICHCTARTGDVLTVTRAQEGTVAQDFVKDATVANRFTAGTLDVILSTSGYSKPEADAKFVDVVGDTMTGHLLLPVSALPGPTAAAPKSYVDTQVATKLSDAPSNANAYGRQGAAWVTVVSTATYTGADILAKLLGVDGSGSNLDADKLDGFDSSHFATQAGLDSLSSALSDETTNRIADVDAEEAARISADASLQTQVNNKVDAAAQDTRDDAQDAAIAAKLSDAPSDGLTYGRKNAAWSTIVGGAVISDTPPAGPLQGGQLWWQSNSGGTFIWYDDGTSAQWVEIAGGPTSTLAGRVKTTIFLVNGIFTPDDNMVTCKVRAWGGGGAGGGHNITTTTNSIGGGGAAGAKAESTLTKEQIGASQAVTIGPGGTGVVAAAGNAGGETSLGTLVRAAGGPGGVAATLNTVGSYLGLLPPAKVQSAAGDIRGWTSGGGGGMATRDNAATTGWFTTGGSGGETEWGGGGLGAQVGPAVGGGGGGAQANTGSGGGGAAAGNSQGAGRAGGAGGSGLLIIDEYLGG